MARKNPPYTPEFRRQMIELVRSGRSPEKTSTVHQTGVGPGRDWEVILRHGPYARIVRAVPEYGNQPPAAARGSYSPTGRRRAWWASFTLSEPIFLTDIDGPGIAMADMQTYRPPGP